MLSIRRLSRTAALLALACAAASVPARATSLGETATATFTDIQTSPGVYDYTLTLNNTGPTTIGEFWFGWVPGAGFLSPVIPSLTDVSSPIGWSPTLTNGGAAIQWIAAPADLLGAGQSLTGFSFITTETPAQLESLVTAPVAYGSLVPEATSFVFATTKITSDTGLQLVATPTPEVPTSLMTLTGAAALAAFRRLRRPRLA